MTTQRIVIFCPDTICSFQRTTPKIEVVVVTGFEPVTLRLSSACSNQLSYTTAVGRRPRGRPRALKLVELRRVELPTFCLQSRRSTTALQPRSGCPAQRPIWHVAKNSPRKLNCAISGAIGLADRSTMKTDSASVFGISLERR